ncbi:MAG: hypothetical protein OEQ53_07050, partial [Saprospiraceae bacterium]|nr:hypothetical protein [Saprospiraceae bacterium]
WVTGDKELLIASVLQGLSGTIDVNGEKYNQEMPGFGFLADADIASILTYIRQSFGNEASAIHVNEISKVRRSTSGGVSN